MHRRLQDGGCLRLSSQAAKELLAFAESLGCEADSVPQDAPTRRGGSAPPGPKHTASTPGAPGVYSNCPPFLGGTHTHLYLYYRSNDSPKFSRRGSSEPSETLGGDPQPLGSRDVVLLGRSARSIFTGQRIWPGPSREVDLRVQRLTPDTHTHTQTH